MSYFVRFYNSGFFGFGEKGNFKYWSLAHFIPIILLIAAIVLIYRYRAWLREWKHEENFRFIFAFVMLMVEMSYFWRLLYVGSSEPFVVVDLLLRDGEGQDIRFGDVPCVLFHDTHGVYDGLLAELAQKAEADGPFD